MVRLFSTNSPRLAMTRSNSSMHHRSPLISVDGSLTDQVEAQRIDTYDPLGDSEKFVFPTGTVIASGAYVVIPKGDAELAHSFGISKDADIISLVSPNGKLVDQSSAGPDEAEPSLLPRA